VENNDENRRHIVYYIRKTRPDIIVTFDPQRHYDLYAVGLEHDDHQTTGSIVLSAAYPRADNPYYYPDQLLGNGGNLQPFKPQFIYLFKFHNTENVFSDPGSKVVVNISEEEMEWKRQAFLQHKSQYRLPSEPIEMVNKISKRLGSSSGGGTEYAEWFTRVVIYH